MSAPHHSLKNRMRLSRAALSVHEQSETWTDCVYRQPGHWGAPHNVHHVAAAPGVGVQKAQKVRGGMPGAHIELTGTASLAMQQ